MDTISAGSAVAAALLTGSTAAAEARAESVLELLHSTKVCSVWLGAVSCARRRMNLPLVR